MARSVLPDTVDRLITEFARLPGIGPKSASRLTFYLLRASGEQALDLPSALVPTQGSTILGLPFPGRQVRGDELDPSLLALKVVPLAIGLLTLFPPLTGFMIVAYIVLAIVLPVKPQNLYETQELAEFWRGVSNAPADVFGSLRHRFRELNLRLERMEAYVTSKEFEIDRELSREK